MASTDIAKSCTFSFAGTSYGCLRDFSYTASADAVDVTCQSDSARRFSVGFKDPGELTVTLLGSAPAEGATGAVVLGCPGSAADVSANGIVTSKVVSGSLGDLITFEVTIKLGQE